MPVLQISDSYFFEIYQNEALKYRVRVSQSLLNEFRKLKSPRSKRGIFVHLFMLYMLAIEDLAMMCLSLKRQGENLNRGLVDVWCSKLSYITLQQSDQILHELDQSANASLEAIRQYLGLPTFKQIAEGVGDDVLIARFQTLDNAKAQYDKDLQFVANQIHTALSKRTRKYDPQVQDDMSLVDLYNSVKHGLRIFADPGHLDEIQIIWKAETKPGQDPNRNELSTVRFRVDLQTAIMFNEQVQAISTIMDGLWGVWKWGQ